jgi:hypothetical protein
MKRRIEANRTGQATLLQEIGGLGDGHLKSEAARKLSALQTELMALNMEMRLGVHQAARNA